MNKEAWVNEVIASTNGMKKAIPNQKLFSKIVQKLPNEKKVKIVSFKYLRWVAVAACLFVGVNVFVFVSKYSLNRIQGVNLESHNLITSYSLYK